MSHTMKFIEVIVCRGEGVSVESLHTGTRKKEIKEARQIVLMLSQEAGITQAAAGSYYGLDHATAHHSKTVIYGLCDSYPRYKARIEQYRLDLNMGMQGNGSSVAQSLAVVEMAIYDLDVKLTSLKTIYYMMRKELEDEALKTKIESNE